LVFTDIPVAKKRANTEVTDTLCPATSSAGLSGLWVEASKAQRTLRSSFWLLPPGRAVALALACRELGHSHFEKEEEKCSHEEALV
jgi:hypothetical protein